MTDKQSATVDVAVTQVIDRPVEVVAAYANDPAHAPQWYANIDEVVWESAPSLREGARAAFVAHFLGRELRYTYEIARLDPTGLVMRTTQGPFPMETSYGYEPVGDAATRMTLRNRGTPSGFSRLAAPFLRRAMGRAMRKDLLALKRVLEDG